MGIIDFFGYTPTERIKYYPGGDLAAGVDISAVIFRTPLAVLQGSGVRVVELQIPNDSTTGVIAIDLGKDLADVKTTGGGGLDRIRIIRMLSGDAGVWRLIGAK